MMIAREKPILRNKRPKAEGGKEGAELGVKKEMEGRARDGETSREERGHEGRDGQGGERREWRAAKRCSKARMIWELNFDQRRWSDNKSWWRGLVNWHARSRRTWVASAAASDSRHSVLSAVNVADGLAITRTDSKGVQMTWL